MATVAAVPEIVQGSGSRFAAVATLPSVGVGLTGDIQSIDVEVGAGTLLRLDVALIAGRDATITLDLFTKDTQATGSLYTLCQVTGLTGAFSQEVNFSFINMDTTRSTTLYALATHTAGAQTTGAMTIMLNIES